jgi:hypothetical protein
MAAGCSDRSFRAGYWQLWTLRALSDTDWLAVLGAVLGQWAGIAAAVFVAVIVLLFNVSAIEVELGTDLDPNRELRDASIVNVVSGAIGDIPGYHALSLTALAERMSVNARTAGLVASLVPLAAVVFGAAFIELIPRMIVGGVLVFLGLAFIVEWVWDKRRILPTFEYVVVLVILAGIIVHTVREGLARGGVVETEGVVRFEPDLDRGLQRCEEGLLEGAGETAAAGTSEELASTLPGLAAYLERMDLPQGTALIRQAEPPEDVFVLESGRLSVELVTPEGTRMRVRTVLPGVVVGEVALYTGVPRTADVVAETPSVVLRLSQASIERMEAEEPELAAALHRWLARTLAERLSDTLKAFDALFD